MISFIIIFLILTVLFLAIITPSILVMRWGSNRPANGEKKQLDILARHEVDIFCLLDECKKTKNENINCS